MPWQQISVLRKEPKLVWFLSFFLPCKQHRGYPRWVIWGENDHLCLMDSCKGDLTLANEHRHTWWVLQHPSRGRAVVGLFPCYDLSYTGGFPKLPRSRSHVFKEFFSPYHAVFSSQHLHFHPIPLCLFEQTIIALSD